MKPAWRLFLHVLAWTAAFPVLGLAITLVARRMSTSSAADVLIARGFEAAFLVWATLIYCRCVPSTSNFALRCLGFIAFFAVLAVIGFYMFVITQVAVIATFGL